MQEKLLDHIIYIPPTLLVFANRSNFIHILSLANLADGELTKGSELCKLSKPKLPSFLKQKQLYDLTLQKSHPDIVV